MFLILQLKALNPFDDLRQHILALMIKDRALVHFAIVNTSLKPMLPCSNWSLSSLLPSSLEISSNWSLAISGFWIALMLSSLTRCRQSISNSLINDSDTRTFLSKLAYSAADISVVNSFSRVSNSKLSSSSTSISSFSPLMLYFSKQFLIVKLVISFHVSFSHQIATSTSTPLKICVADTSSWILASTYLTSLFRYLSLKFWMMPPSSGCNLEVVLSGKTMILICENWAIINSKWHIALSEKGWLFRPQIRAFC